MRPTPPAAVPPRPTVSTARQPGWRSLDVLRATALVLGLYLLLQLLWLAHDLLFITFLGVLFGLAVGRGADVLERFRLPRGISAVLIVAAFLGIIFGLGAWAAPTLRAQAGELQTQLPQALDRIEGWMDDHRAGFLGQFMPARRTSAQAPAPGAATPGAPAPAATGAPAAKPAEPSDLSSQLGAVTRYLFSFLSSTVAVLAGLLLILFTAIYIGAEPDLYHKGLLHLFPHEARPRAAEVLKAIGVTLRKWLVAQVIMMVVIGVIDAVGLPCWASRRRWRWG